MEISNLQIISFQILTPFLKIAVLLLLIFYSIFALIIVRQVDLMSKTLITPVSKLVTGVAIINAGFAIGFTLLVFGIL